MPEEKAPDSLRELAAAMQELYRANPAFASRVQRQIGLYQEKAINEPLTLRQDLARLYSDFELSPQFQSFLEKLLNNFAGDPSPDFDYYLPAHDLFCFIETARKRIGSPGVHSLLNAKISLEMAIRRARIIEATKQPTDLGFERRVRTIAEVLRESAEEWYKPILQLCLLLSHRLTHTTNSAVPNELGAVMWACKHTSGFPLTILDDRIRIIRNSVAHSQTEIDVAEPAVTFVNTRRSGERDSLGPLTWEHLKAFADYLLNHCWALTLVLRRQKRLSKIQNQ
jgi:hypothetical protein